MTFHRSKTLILYFMTAAAFFLNGCSQKAADTKPVDLPKTTPTTLPLPTASVEPIRMQLKYQPMQCEKDPWQTWYELGEVQFIKPPTEVELITAYYTSQAVEVNDVKKIDRDIAVCEACSICETTAYFHLTATADMAEKLLATGWKQSN